MKNMKRDDIMKKLYAGFDIHKEELTGTVMNKQGTIVLSGEFPNTKGAVQSFFTGIPSPQVTIAIEACSIWRGVYRMLTGLGYQVVLADPAKTHLIAGKKKTDEVDSKTLADLLRTGYLPQVYIPSEDVLKLRDIARHRARLVRIRQRLKCSVKSYMNRDGIQYKNSWSKTNMEDLKALNPHIGHFIDIIEVTTEKIKEVEKKIRQIARNKSLANLLRTIPGVAEFSALMILGEIGDINRFPHPKNLVSYAGLCPGIYQSGKKRHTVESKACNTWLKWIMYVCSGKATTMKTKYMKHYLKIKERKGMPTARRSVARKMLQDIWHMLKKQEPFNPS